MPSRKNGRLSSAQPVSRSGVVQSLGVSYRRWWAPCSPGNRCWRIEAQATTVSKYLESAIGSCVTGWEQAYLAHCSFTQQHELDAAARLGCVGACWVGHDWDKRINVAITEISGQAVVQNATPVKQSGDQAEGWAGDFSCDSSVGAGPYRNEKSETEGTCL